MVTKPDENYDQEPLPKKKRKNTSFSSLPDDILVNCLARISRSYYPKLSLVCKTFRSLIVSHDLNAMRFHLKTQETKVHVCLQFPDTHRPSLFTLWIKPGQILINNLEKKMSSTQNTRLVQLPSSCFSYIPMYYVAVGSEWYRISQCDAPSSIIWVLNKDSYLWREASNMTVAREKALACVLNGKLYVMGGCTADESTNWGEVFDPKTQTWEPLPDPGPKLRFSSIRKIEVIKGKLYVRSNEEKDSVYDPKKGKWKVAQKSLFVKCVIDNVWYRYGQYSFSWYDTKRKEWRLVRGLEMLNRYGSTGGMTEIANYGGKLLILWDKFVYPPRPYKHIWCAVIALERRDGIQTDEVWGNIEWANIVHTVPSSYVFLRSVLNVV